MTIRTLYELAEAKEGWSFLADKRWAEAHAYGKTNCPECGWVYFHLHRQPIHAKMDQIPRRRSIGLISFMALGIIHARLLDVLSKHMDDFAFGDVYNERDEVVRDYRTFYSSTYIEPRGQSGSTWRTCPGCSRVMYSWKGEPYVLSKDLDDRHVYHDVICSVYVDEYLASAIDWRKFKDLKLVPFPVLDRPLDGLRLPGDPDWDAMPPLPEEEQRRVRLLFDETAEPAAPKPRGSARPPKPPDPQRVRKALTGHKLSTRAVDFLMSRARPGFRLERAGRVAKPMSAVPLGASRLGGIPDLPLDFTWPTGPQGEALAFLGQINLQDAAGIPCETPLPERGQLYFFYDAQEQPWGYNPQSCGRWRVAYHDLRVGDLVRTPAPKGLPDVCRFEPRAVKLKPTLFLPSAETLSDELEPPPGPGASAEDVVRRALETTLRSAPRGARDGDGSHDPLASLREALDSEQYTAWAERIHGTNKGGPDHRFLGYPHEEQSSMPAGFARLVAERPDREFPDPMCPGNTLFIAGRRADAWPAWARKLLGETPADQWRCLLQLDSEGWMWGDGGKLYFWIPREDLAARRFENVWIELQCG